MSPLRSSDRIWLNASSAVTTAKNAFLGIWNPMAPRYGQRTYSSTDF